jgi:sec-independent protein translocase protein TatA
MMGLGSVWHWIIVLIVVLVLFGRGRVADIMGEFGKGLKSFKQGLNDEDKNAAPPPAQIPAPPAGQPQDQNTAAKGETVAESNQTGSR